MAPSYLDQLSERIRGRLAAADLPFRAQHAAFLAACQAADGGFCDREGGGDLYYTGFGLRALDCLDALDEPLCRRAAAFLRQRLHRPASIVDFVSLLYGARLVQVRHGLDTFERSRDDWADAVAEALATFRCRDGGYAKARRPDGQTPAEGVKQPSSQGVKGQTGDTLAALDGSTARRLDCSSLDSSSPRPLGPSVSSSTYHTFLVALCYQMICRPLPDPDSVVRFLLSRRREDGGFVELGAMRRSGTNPTAAAIALLRMLDACDEKTAKGASAFLACMQSQEGGLRANGRAPLADLLSTFTGLLTLADLSADDRVDLAAARRFAESLSRPQGGFRGGSWDSASDAEYTFYGLGALALLCERR